MRRRSSRAWRALGGAGTLRPWRAGVRVILCPRERSRARVGRMATVIRYGGDARAIAVVHRAHENLTPTVLGQHGLLGRAGIGVVSWSKN